MSHDRMIACDAVVASVRFLADGRLAGTCMDGKVRLWAAASGDLTTTVAQDAGDSGQLLLDNAGCAAIGTDGAPKIRDLDTGAVVRQLSRPKTAIKRLTASHDGSLIAGFGPVADKANEWMAHLWDRTGRERFAVPCGAGEVWATGISPDGTTLAAGSWDTDIRIWNTATGKQTALIEELTMSMFALDFSPDGRIMAVAGADRTVSLFDTTTWKVTRTLPGQDDVIVSLAFSKDGRKLATGGFSGRPGRHPAQVVVRDVASGKITRRVTAPDAVWSLGFSPDGTRVASVTGDKHVALWAANE
jgi:WD40 repeat protein